MSTKGSGNNTHNKGGGAPPQPPTRTGPSYEETVVHGKKRKVWRSHHSNTSNMMSPEAAANYLQQAAEAAAAAAAAGSGGESVQITLGPNGIAATTTSSSAGVATGSVNMESLQWMNPNFAGGGSRNNGSAGGNNSTASNNPLAGMGVNMNMSMNLNTNSVSFGGLDLAALAKAGDLSALTNAAARNVAATQVSLGIPSTTPSIATTANAAAIDASIARKLAPAGTAHIPTGSSKSALAGASIPGGGGGGKDSLPCSEAEMKALMSMFVEIMGMSMNTEKLGKSTAAKKRAARAKKNGENNTSTSSNSSSSDGILDPSNFSFGSGDGAWPDPAIAAATGDLDALNAHRYAYSDDEDEDEDDSLPDLDDMAEVQKQRRSNADKTNDSTVKVKSGAALLPTNTNPTPITGRSGIAPVEWESLEQVAIEDAMEAEERARKAAKRREKKNRKKEKARKEAAAKAAEEASKKQEKAIVAWRSRVVAACQSNEVEKLVALLEESPFTLLNNNNNHNNGMSAAVGVDADATPIMTMATMTPHLEFLLPHTVAKNRASAERGNDARTKLANFVMNTNLPMVFTTPLRTGRTPVHTACLHGELDFVQHALALAKIWEAQEGDSSLAAVLPPNYLQLSCQESGFAPIHYAVLSGAKPILEALLEAGADVKLKSSDTHTWKSSTGKGISPRELAETVSHGSQDKVLETHGLALQEAIQHYSSSNDEKKKYRAVLERMRDRLKDVEQNGYSPPPPEPEIVPEEPKAVDKTPSPVDTSKSATATNNDDDNDSEEPDVTELIPQQEESNNKTTGKKKKKKKKKGQQADSDNAKNAQLGGGENSGAATASQNISAQDPLVVALLGMGFTEEQIQAAVKACGGTDRATADDLVVWILSEGASTEAPAPVPAPVQPRVVEIRKAAPPPAPKPAPKPVPKLAPKPPPAPVQQSTVPSKPKPKEVSPAVEEARAKEAKAVATKEEEARLKEQRLAAKREEKMRRNREWNEKAQARQNDEEKAKIAQAVADANRVATERALQAAAIQQQQQLQLQAQQHARMAQAHAQQHAPHMMGQQATNFFPGGAPGMMGPPHHGHPSNMGMPPPPPGHYGMGMPPTSGGYGGPGRHTPQSTTGNMLDAASRMVEAQHAAQAHVRAQSYDSNYNQQLPPHSHPPPGMQKMVPPPPQHGWEQSSNHGHNMYNNPDVSSHYPNIPDDSTVSSYGSGRVSVPSNFSAALPPGFRQNPTTSSLPPPLEEGGSVASYEENPLGEMRATAREFVPSFSSRPSSRGASSSQAPPPAAATEPPKTSRLPALAAADRPPAPTAPSGLTPSGLIGGVNNFGSSLLSSVPPPGHDLTSSLMGAPAEHFSPVTRSSDIQQLPKGLGLEKGVSDSGVPAGLATLTSGLTSGSFDTGAALWGGIGSGSPAVSAPADASTGVAGIPMSGLSSLALPTGDSKTSGIVPRSDSLGGEALLPSGLGGPGTWGTANLSSNNTGAGGGSIW